MSDNNVITSKSDTCQIKVRQMSDNDVNTSKSDKVQVEDNSWKHIYHFLHLVSLFVKGSLLVLENVSKIYLKIFRSVPMSSCEVFI